jgi:hypothetical protein
MSDRRENSVLFSLRELRTIEEDRVHQEAETERARIEAERRAREEEIRRAKEAEEAKVRAAEEKVRREQEERERAQREDDLRLKESERRAQIEAAAKLEQHRIEAEARARMDAKKFPVGKVVGGVVALVLISGITVGVLIHNHSVELQQREAELQAKAEQERKALVARQEAEKVKFESEMRGLQAQLEKATNDADRAKIRAQIAAASDSRSHHSSSSSRPKDDTAKPAKAKINTDTKDPLGGLGL